jgi:hypothetical protein
MSASPDPAWLRQRVEDLEGHLSSVRSRIHEYEKRLDGPAQLCRESKELLKSLLLEKAELLQQQHVLTAAILRGGQGGGQGGEAAGGEAGGGEAGGRWLVRLQRGKSRYASGSEGACM